MNCAATAEPRSSQLSTGLLGEAKRNIRLSKVTTLPPTIR